MIPILKDSIEGICTYFSPLCIPITTEICKNISTHSPFFFGKVYVESKVITMRLLFCYLIYIFFFLLFHQMILTKIFTGILTWNITLKI